MQNLRHFLAFSDLNRAECHYLFERTQYLKAKFKKYTTHHPLHDRTLAMIFEKNSTRTRLSFEAGIHQLGGHAVYLNNRDTQAGRGEPIEDTARVISRMVDIIMIRTFHQSDVIKFAEHSRVPVINGLTNELHPCQVLADIFTYWEKKGSLQGRTVAWIGDVNNMAYTWMQAAEILDFNLHIACPSEYGIAANTLASQNSRIKQFTNLKDACYQADIVTTDVWTSMGFETENQVRQKAFTDYRVNAEVMAVAQTDAMFMHCLPAHRGEEVTAEVIDGPQSVVWDEAENRLHAQKALMEFLLLGQQPNV